MKGPVLIVEDDADLREALRDLLADAGYPVHTAGNGTEALEAVSRVRPAVVFLDLMMPVMDGWTCLEELPEDISVVVLSAHVRDAKSMSAAALIRRPAGFMTKPVKREVVLEVARDFCGGEPAALPTAAGVAKERRRRRPLPR